MPHKASTFRLQPALLGALEHLSSLLGRPMNQLVNEAVKDFVAKRSGEVEAELTSTLERLRAYRAQDPTYEAALDDFVNAEVAGAKHDPVEGKRIASKSASAETKHVRALLRG